MKFALAAGVLAFWSAPALADRQQNPLTSPSLDVMVAKYTQCLVRKHHNAAKAYILSEPGEGAGRDKFPVRDKACLVAFEGGQVSFVFDMYRDGIANALVEADFPTQGPRSFSNKTALDHPPSPSDVWRNRNNFAWLRERADLSRMGECIARVDPEAARLWALTRPNSAEDLSQRAAIGSMFDRCSKQFTGALAYNAEIVRGPVALNYYRLANAPVRQEDGASH